MNLARAPQPRVLCICGSLNQTTQMHQIAAALPECEAWFTPFYVTGSLAMAKKARMLERTVCGHRLGRRCLRYLERHGLPIDLEGRRGGYDLVLLPTDLHVPNNLDHVPKVLVQEGMIDPPNIFAPWVKRSEKVPRWLTSTASTGMSRVYERFCVASVGYRDHFVRNGLDPARLVVTGIPNFDDCARYHRNDFPHRDYVLVATSDARETFKLDRRKQFIRRAVRIADGRPLVFKLHPNEKVERATREIEKYAPGALVFAEGCAEEMVANCTALICQYSTLAFVGVALGKEVHSYFDPDELRRLLPEQNGCAARRIAAVCREVLASGAGRALLASNEASGARGGFSTLWSGAR